MRCRSPYLAISIFSESEQKLSFLVSDLEAHLASLPVMASGDDHSERL
jgi:hypothetical protein